jgi:hypothetical protein
MGILAKFGRDERGNMVQSISVMAFSVALASMGGAYFLDKVSRDAHIQDFVPAGAAERYQRTLDKLPRGGRSEPVINRQFTVDYMPTGSIPQSLAQPVVLDPCTGAQK